MTSEGTTRRYRKRKRARAEEETRRRITEAAVELHGTVGPANTTVTEIARLAGVSRMTVYNHFPADTDLYEACSNHWAACNPLPDPAGWRGVADPSRRLKRALTELYQWYGPREEMLENVLRDAEIVPSLGTVMEDLWGRWTRDVMGALTVGWSVRREDAPALQAMLRLVVDFGTWQSLSGSGMDDARAAELAARMVTGAVQAG